MRLIKTNFEIWEQPTGLEGMYKQIELIGRVCTKSEDKITDTSAKEFVEKMIKLNHGAVLEHGSIYLYIDYHDPSFNKVIDRYANNKYSKCNYFPTFPNKAYISSNLRVLIENDWLDDLKYLCEPTKFHEKRICVKFVLPIGISREFCRHRTFSFMELSTRYVNMSGDKVGNEITFIKPAFKPDFIGSAAYYEWEIALMNAEASYNNLIKAGLKPQVARGVLPLDTKTELYMTGFISDWKHFFRLRSRIAETGKPHPQAQELADLLMDEFIKREYINE